MIKIYKSEKSRNIFIEGVSWGSFDDIRYLRDGNLFSIDRNSDGVFEVSNASYLDFQDGGSNTFSSANAFESYLQGILSDEYLVTSSTPVNSDAFLTEETVTSLQIVANQLRFTDENGNTNSIDLSVYLDDTNLSRIVSGVLDSSTNVVTFTRDDSTTFTIDFSDMVAGMSSLNSLSDVDTTGVLNNSFLKFDSSTNNWIPYRLGFDFVSSSDTTIWRTGQTTEALANQQMLVFEDYLVLNYTATNSGVYEIKSDCVTSSDQTGDNLTVDLNITGDVSLNRSFSSYEPKDSRGNGEVVNIVASGIVIGNTNTGTDIRKPQSTRCFINLNSGQSVSISLRWRSQSINDESTIYFGNISIEEKIKA